MKISVCLRNEGRTMRWILCVGFRFDFVDLWDTDFSRGNKLRIYILSTDEVWRVGFSLIDYSFISVLGRLRLSLGQCRCSVVS